MGIADAFGDHNHYLGQLCVEHMLALAKKFREVKCLRQSWSFCAHHNLRNNVILKNVPQGLSSPARISSFYNKEYTYIWTPRPKNRHLGVVSWGWPKLQCTGSSNVNSLDYGRASVSFFIPVGYSACIPNCQTRTR